MNRRLIPQERESDRKSIDFLSLDFPLTFTTFLSLSIFSVSFHSLAFTHFSFTFYIFLISCLSLYLFTIYHILPPTLPFLFLCNLTHFFSLFFVISHSTISFFLAISFSFIYELYLCLFSVSIYALSLFLFFSLSCQSLSYKNAISLHP